VCLVVYGGVQFAYGYLTSLSVRRIAKTPVVIGGGAAAVDFESSSDSKKSGSSASSARKPPKKRSLQHDALGKTLDSTRKSILVSGMQMDETLDPKEQLFREFREKGHTPFQRNSRYGYINVWCYQCNAKCGASSNIAGKSGWYVTTFTSEANRQCSSNAGK
jgi:hypothetical protein